MINHHPPRFVDSQNFFVTSFVTMSARVVTVSVDEFLVILHFQVKVSHCVSVRYRDIRELKHKLAGNFQKRLTFDAKLVAKQTLIIRQTWHDKQFWLTCHCRKLKQIAVWH